MVKTQEKSPVQNVNTTSASSLHNLERQQRYLMTLSRQINSYHCVPKTVTLHEQLESLRKAMRVHAEENKALIRSIQNPAEDEEKYLSDCEIQYQKMLRLEREILAYIGRARVLG